MKAKDVMTTPVRTVAPDASVEAIAGLLVEHRISGVPVVDGTGRLVGIVSEGDLLRRPEIETEPRASWWLTLLSDRTALAEDYVKSHGRRAADVMTRPVVTVDEEASLAEIADLLQRHRIKRVPVLRNGALVGIVSRANLVGVLARRAVAPLRAVSDKELLDRLMGGLSEQPWADSSLINVEVVDGIVHYRGMLVDPAQREALRVYAENLPGVNGVRDETVIRPMPNAV